MSRFQIVLIPVTAFQQNCSLIWETETRRCVVVDPGGEPERILAAIAKFDLVVEKILLTHGHLDHAGGAHTLRHVLNVRRATTTLPPVPIIGPDERDRFLLEHIEADAQRHGLPGLRNVVPDQWLHEGEVVELGALRFDVLHCPGHTPGHVVFVEQATRFAIVGDVLFRGSVGRCDFPYGDAAALIHAIHEKLLPLGDDITFICGHGPGSSFGAERQTNPFLQG
jgi:glyoxylase-like metal-dependent hydrolase (beta-lactamase superfamily II)